MESSRPKAKWKYIVKFKEMGFQSNEAPGGERVILVGRLSVHSCKVLLLAPGLAGVHSKL